QAAARTNPDGTASNLLTAQSKRVTYRIKMTTPANRALRYGVAIGGVIVALVLVVVFFPWNLLRGPLATYASVRFDRPVAINGDLDVELGWTTRVQVDGV